MEVTFYWNDVITLDNSHSYCNLTVVIRCLAVSDCPSLI